MLQSLRVKNFAIVEDIRVGLEKGLNVITGETGAGKSILISALSLLLGERADKSMIRSGEDQCMVEAVFLLEESSTVDAKLDSLGLEPCEEGRLIIRRTVSATGTGRNFVNDSPATLQALSAVGDVMVDMHGPHDHQSLLRQDFQLDLLDAFGGLHGQRDTYQALYRRMGELKKERRALEGDDQDVAMQIDMLSYQVKEIEAAELSEADEGDLEREHTVVANAQRILELTEGIRQALTEGEGCAFDGAGFAQNALNELSQMVPEAGAWHEEARSIAVQIQELSDTVTRYAQNVEGDPVRLQWLEDRMALLYKLKRKYGGSLEGVRDHLDAARKRLQALETRGEQIAAIEGQWTEIEKQLKREGTALAGERRASGKRLAKSVTRELRELGFPHGGFDIKLEPCEPGPAGMDEVEFGFAPNVGEAMRPLRKIASSGEISRVMLATKAVLSGHDRIPVLVFDEVDANVGGEMGNAIGEKLAGVAGQHQVICITHLPQVAVHGTNHLVVAKEVKDGRTSSRISPISGREREEEIARMLGGKGLTKVTLQHAREMLTRINKT